MPHELAAVGIVDAHAGGKFSRLADVVQKDPRQHEVAVYLRIKRQNRPRRARHAQCVLQQAADERVMHLHRRRCALEGLHKVAILHEFLYQQPQVLVLDVAENLQKFGPHLLDVAGGGGQEVGQVHLVPRVRAA